MRNKHPRGLLFLFFTEMWERFGYYLIIGIFVLYMIDPAATGGMAFSDKYADDIFGTYIALTYLTPFLGGYLADRVLGYFKAIYLGGFLMGLGYIGLGFHNTTAFYVSMALIIVGNGFFKPSISTLVGNLYSTDEYKANKDAGYNIFYMGINIGAFICNIIAAFMRNQYGWSAAFITAGIGMFIGLIIFTLGRKHLHSANVMKPVQEGDISLGRILGMVFLPAIICGAIGWMIPDNIFKSDSTDAFIFACIPIIVFYVRLYLKANHEDKRPLGALLAIFAVGMLFWAVFKQNGTALTRWANYYTDRQVTGSTEQALSSIYLVDKKDFQTKEVQKYDNQFQAEKDEAGEPIKVQGKDVYFTNISNEQRAELEKDPNQTVSLINTELFQSVNPGWIILLTPVVVGFFMFMRKRGKEPSTPSKIVLGLFISALSCLFMVAAVYIGSNGAVKVSPLWLVGTYGVITIGELCLSPMGLSIVSKLSPPRLTALMMGGFFLSISIGNKLSGVLASMWYDYENKANFFLVNCLLLLFATLLGLSILKRLNAVMKEKGLN
ncbi:MULTISPECIES: peptide MFS transporter [Flavobacterium]|uniref:peptide MFS transporter n=1 Tax=Flavobacterium TaxID=237 RepID=UPI001FCB813D|nr:MULTISPECIES: peptide MFS transporter [Flavobacterium]UOK43515.1 peptide MFS transporter [Flavobacterium enshiense]